MNYNRKILLSISLMLIGAVSAAEISQVDVQAQFFQAIRTDNLKEAKLAIKLGADIYERFKIGKYDYSILASIESYEMAEVLIEVGMDLDKVLKDMKRHDWEIFLGSNGIDEECLERLEYFGPLLRNKNISNMFNVLNFAIHLACNPDIEDHVLGNYLSFFFNSGLTTKCACCMLEQWNLNLDNEYSSIKFDDRVARRKMIQQYILDTTIKAL